MTRRRLGRAGIVNDALLHVLRQPLPFLKPFVQPRMRDIPGHHDPAGQKQPCRHGVAAQIGPDLVHGAVQIDPHRIGDRCGGFRKVLRRVCLQLLEKYPRVGYLGLDVAVGAAADPQADGTGGTVPRQANDAHVMAEVFAAELGPDAQLARQLQQLRLERHVTKGMSGRTAGCGQTVQVTG